MITILTIMLFMNDPVTVPNGRFSYKKMNTSVSFSHVEIHDPARCDAIGKMLAAEQVEKAIAINPQGNWKATYDCRLLPSGKKTIQGSDSK